MSSSAGEIIQAVRDLHKPIADEYDREPFCGHCVDLSELHEPWPCDTARLVYSEDEIASLPRGTVTP